MMTALSSPGVSRAGAPESTALGVTSLSDFEPAVGCLYLYEGGNPINRVDPLGLQSTQVAPAAPPPAPVPFGPPPELTADQRHYAGIAYGETANLFPQYAAGSTVRSADNWDPASQHELTNARAWIAAIAANGGKTTASVSPTAQELKTPYVQKTWESCEWGGIKGDPAKIGGADVKHFVIWPSANGKTPDQSPRMKADWPYTQTDKIIEVFGPFRKTARGGDVPISDNVYVFVYKGVK